MAAFLFFIENKLVIFEDLKINFLFLKFFERDAGRLCLTHIKIDTRGGTTLELLAALGGKYDHAVFRIDLRRIDDLFLFDSFLGLFCALFYLVGHNLGYSPSNRCLDASKLSRIPFMALVCLSVDWRSAVIIEHS